MEIGKSENWSCDGHVGPGRAHTTQRFSPRARTINAQVKVEVKGIALIDLFCKIVEWIRRSGLSMLALHTLCPLESLNTLCVMTPSSAAQLQKAA